MKHLFIYSALIVFFQFAVSPVFGLTKEFTVDGETTGDQYGDAVATVDFNADGFDDIVVGAPASDAGGLSSGKIYIYFGGAGADNVADLEIIGPEGSFFGSAIADAGDVNNDTYTDLIVGAPFYSVIASRAGAAYIFYGGPSPDTTIDLALYGAASLDYYGTSVTGDVDFNGDLIDDFAVGAYKADYGTYENAGLVAVHFGSAAPDTVADVILTGGADGERFGISLAAGNFNGDGYGDLAAGAYSFDDWDINLGRAYIFFGGASPDSLFDYAVGGEAQGVFFGFSLDAGNVNADGFDDLFVGAYGYKIGQAEAGKVYLYEGGGTMDTIADYTHSLGVASADNLGLDVAAGIDIDGDLVGDFWAGYPGGDGGVLYAGGAFAVDTMLDGENTGENFGHDAALAARFFGAQKPAIVVGAFAYDNYRGRAYFYLQDNSSGNQPPVLDPIGDQWVMEEFNLNFAVTASDPDGTIPELRTSSLPSGANFTDHGDGTGTFDWTPVLGQAGNYNVTFYAEDSIDADSEEIAIIVSEMENFPPVLDSIGPKSVMSGNNLNFVVTSTDPNQTIPFLYTSTLPGDADFVDHGTGSGTFNWTPTISDTGEYQVTFYASDGTFIDSEQVIITVFDESAIICGDANADFTVNIGDPVFLINYIFKGGPAPNPLCRAEVNADGTLNIGDPVYLINYIFKGGDPPVEPCCP